MQVREIIELLTKILEENGTSAVQAETFRAAKFNKDSAAMPLWRLLFQLLYFTKHGVLNEKVLKLSEEAPGERLVGQVKRELQSRGYVCRHLARLPDSGTSGSRELLLAVTWLLATAAIIDRFITRHSSPLDQDYRVWTLSQQESLLPQSPLTFGPSKSESAQAQAQRLLLLTGKLRLSLRQLYALQQQEAKLTAKVHESTRGVSLAADQPHLSVLEVQLLRHPAMMKKMLKLLEEDNTRLQHLLLFKEQEKVFWKWMESILDLRNQELGEDRATDGEEEAGRPHHVYLPVSSDCPQHIEAARQELLQAILKYESTISQLEELWLHKKSAVSKYDLDKLLASILAEIAHHQANLKLLGQESSQPSHHTPARLVLQSGKARDGHRVPRVSGGRPYDQGVGGGQVGTGEQCDLGQLILELEEEVQQLELELRQKQISGRDCMLSLAKSIPSVVCIEPMALHNLSTQLQ